LRSFVLINFYEIRRADRLDLRDALAYLIATHFKMDSSKVKVKLSSLVSKSQTPVELLRSINEHFQKQSLR
jgi:hypothetical protein